MSPERSSRRYRKKWRQEMSERQYSLSMWRLGRRGEEGFHDQCVALRRITVHCWSQLFHFCWRHLCKVKSGCHHGHNYGLCQRLETESVYVKPSEELDDLFTLYRMWNSHRVRPVEVTVDALKITIIRWCETRWWRYMVIFYLEEEGLYQSFLKMSGNIKI